MRARSQARWSVPKRNHPNARHSARLYFLNHFSPHCSNATIDVANWTEKEILLRDLGRLYHDLAGEWLLLEILEGAEKKLPTKFRLHAHHHDKDKLREFILEHDSWDWSKKYLFVQADPQKPCEIGS